MVIDHPTVCPFLCEVNAVTYICAIYCTHHIFDMAHLKTESSYERKHLTIYECCNACGAKNKKTKNNLIHMRSSLRSMYIGKPKSQEVLSLSGRHLDPPGRRHLDAPGRRHLGLVGQKTWEKMALKRLLRRKVLIHQRLGGSHLRMVFCGSIRHQENLPARPRTNGSNSGVWGQIKKSPLNKCKLTTKMVKLTHTTIDPNSNNCNGSDG